jgi:UDP-N-acetyl-D-mannosaminuronic acid dehydrogenase
MAEVISSQLEKVNHKTARIAVIGLGHVGLPLALTFARAGFNVTGIDVDARKLEALRHGSSYIQEPGLHNLMTACLRDGTFRIGSDGSDAIRGSDFVSICVPTPVQNYTPDLTAFHDALHLVMSGAHKRMMILVESTLPPSTMSSVVAPELQAPGYQIDEDVFLAYCPERIAPGNAMEEFVNNTHIVGGAGPRSGRLAAELYKTVCKEVLVTDCLTAELSKLAENTFRDTNIAFANLLALLAEEFGADVNEVIRLANTHPRVRIHRPGLGVGGPCLPKDPLMLVQGVGQEKGQLIRLARNLNDSMAEHAIDVVTKTMGSNGVDIRNARISVLGVAYKPETEDVTNSPAGTLVEGLLKTGASVVAYDPYTTETYGAIAARNLDDALKGADCVIVVTAHASFRSLDLNRIAKLAKEGCFVFDGPRILDPTRAKSVGLTYQGTGYGVSHENESSA